MRRESILFRSVSSIAAGLIATLSAVGIAATPGSLSFDWQARVTLRVQQVVGSAQGNTSSPATIAGSAARFDSKNRLHIDVEFNCAHAAPTASLITAGMVIGTTMKVPPMCVVEGWIAVANIPALAGVSTVTKIDLPKYSKSHPPISPHSQISAIGTSIAMAANGTPAIDGNGITIMNVDKYIQRTSVNGAGITIGIISTDVASLALIQGRAELPVSINVVTPSANPSSHATLTDEGTMMLEEVYAVAPGAHLAFCGPETYIEYLGCVQNLIAAGVTVVSDDLTFDGGDVMSAPAQNQPALAVANLLTANPTVMLFHSVGNDAKDYWQGAYNPIQVTAGATCGGLTDNYFQQFGTSTHDINWHTNGGKTLFLASVLTSGQPMPNNFDLYVYNPATSQVVACSTAATGSRDGSTSYTVIDGSMIPQGAFDILVGTQDASLSGGFLKLIGNDDGGGTFSSVTAGAPNSPQDFAAGVIMVGAVSGIDGIGNTIEPYSDTGPIQIEVPTASTLQAPQLVAPDAIYVDNSGTLFFASGGIFPGTSAASPNTAAVAVLLRSAFPTLTPVQVTNFMQAGAAPLGASSPNGTFGYGRVDALGALAAIPGPTLSGLQGISIVGGGAPAVVPFTVGGTGAVAVSTSSSVSLTASGSAAVAISPPTCGNPTAACTLTVTPAVGSFGTANIQVAVKDGANRSSSVPVAVAVTKPAAPTVSLTSGASQSVNVNTSIAPVMFTLTGTGSLVVTPVTSNVAGLTITSGCGTTTMTCTANLGTAMSSAGTATLAITVKDAYVQSASATATVIETVPPKSGGGGVDRWTLLALGCLVLLRASRFRLRDN
jgi:hypothetical protein